jgi:ankyrin repeat protein
MQEKKLSRQGKAAGKPGIASQNPKTEGIAPGKERLESLNRRLFEAAKNGKTEKAVRLLDAGADANAKDSDDRTPLMWAAYNGHTDVCKLLLSCGAKIKAKDRYGWDAVRFAAARERASTVDFLQAYAETPTS